MIDDDDDDLDPLPISFVPASSFRIMLLAKHGCVMADSFLNISHVESHGYSLHSSYSALILWSLMPDKFLLKWYHFLKETWRVLPFLGEPFKLAIAALA